jgi:hypothetical protein
MNKLLLMQVAAQLTQAACDSVPAPLSADVADEAARAKNLQVWETFRIYYHALLKALPDTSWPAPQVDAGSILPNLGATLAGLLTGSGPLAALVQRLLAALPAVSS